MCVLSPLMKSPLLEPGSLDRYAVTPSLLPPVLATMCIMCRMFSSKDGELTREMEAAEGFHLHSTKPRSTSDPKNNQLVQTTSVRYAHTP